MLFLNYVIEWTYTLSNIILGDKSGYKYMLKITNYLYVGWFVVKLKPHVYSE